jgi:hypothetical protein
MFVRASAGQAYLTFDPAQYINVCNELKATKGVICQCKQTSFKT